MKVRAFTVLMIGFLLVGQVCSAAGIGGTFLHLAPSVNHPVTCEPSVKPTLITTPQPLTLSPNSFVFLSTSLVSDAQAVSISTDSNLETPCFPSSLRDGDILECSVAYHDPPLRIRQAAHLRLDIDAEEWFGIMRDKHLPPPPKNLATVLLENYTSVEILDICNGLLSRRHVSPKGVFRVGVPEPASWFLLLALMASVLFWQRWQMR